jgi:DNA-binding MarR family transcriptional regulator
VTGFYRDPGGVSPGGRIVQLRTGEGRVLVVIEPTDAGWALVPRLLPAFRGVTAQLLAGLSAEEAAVLQAMLRRLLSNVRSVEP